MRLGAMMLSFTQLGDDHRPFRESLEMARRAGFEYISLLHDPSAPSLQDGVDPPRSFIDVFRSDPDALDRALEANGLRWIHVHAGGLDVTSDDTTRASAEALIGYARDAAARGCSVLSFGLRPALPDGLGAAQRTEYLDRVRSGFSVIAKELAPTDIRLGADVHYHAPIERVDDAAYVLDGDEQRTVGLCLNMGHLSTARQAGWELIERYPDAIVVAAYKDHLPPARDGRSFESVRLGAGDTPLVNYVRALQAAKIDPYHVISIEDEPWDEKEESMQESRRYLQNLWEEVEKES